MTSTPLTAGGRRPRHLRASTSTVAANLVNVGLGAASGVATARALDPDGRGILVGLFLWAATIATLSMVGVDEALIYSTAKHPNSLAGLRVSLQRRVRAQCGIGAVVLAAVAVLIVRHDPALMPYALAVIAVIPLNAFTMLSFAELRVRNRVHTWNAVRLLPSSLFTVGVIALALADRLTVPSGVVALVAANVVTASIAGLTRQAPDDRYAASSTTRAATISYGRRLVLATLPYSLNQRLDQLLLGLLIEPAALGVYAVAVAFSSLFQVLGTSIEQIVFPAMASGRMSRQQMRRAMVVTMSLLALVAVPISYFARDVIGLLYGSAYEGASTAVAILLAAAVLNTGALALTGAAKAEGALRAIMHAQVAALAASAVVLLPLYHLLGIEGAALGALIGQTVSFGMMLAASRRRDGRAA